MKLFEEASKKQVSWTETSVDTTLMICIMEQDDGKVGILHVMSSLGIVSSEAESVFRITTIEEEC